MSNQSAAQTDQVVPATVTNDPSFAPPPNSFFSKPTNAAQSFVSTSSRPPSPELKAVANFFPATQPPLFAAPVTARPTLKLFMREQTPIEFKLHYFESPPSPAERSTEIGQLQKLIMSQIKPASDQRLWHNVSNLVSGELEQKGFFKIQHGYYDHYIRRFLQPDPNTWLPIDFWLKLPSENQELIPADLYQYDVGAVIEKDQQGTLKDASLIIYVNKEGKVGRPKVWERKTPEELKAVACNYLVFVRDSEEPIVGIGSKNGERAYFIAILNETDKFIRQCYVSQDGYIRIDLNFK